MTGLDDWPCELPPAEFEAMHSPNRRGTLILEFVAGDEEYGITIYPGLFPEDIWNYCDATEFVRNEFAKLDGIERGMGLAQVIDISPLSSERPVALVTPFCGRKGEEYRILDPNEPYVREIETGLAALLHRYIKDRGLR